MAEFDQERWISLFNFPHGQRWICGYCDHKVSSNQGFYGGEEKIFICPDCQRPTFFLQDGRQVPGALPGQSIPHLPSRIEDLYEESRRCMSMQCFTSAVMLCRVVLFHVAKDKGLTGTRASYQECVKFLTDKGWIGLKDVEWVDKIRAFGNVANHELTAVDESDATVALRFTQHILTSLYHFRQIIGSPGDDVEGDA